MSLDLHHPPSRPARPEGPRLADGDVPGWHDAPDPVETSDEHPRAAYAGDRFGVEYWIAYRERRNAEHLEMMAARPRIVHDSATCEWCGQDRDGLARLRMIQAAHDRGVA